MKRTVHGSTKAYRAYMNICSHPGCDKPRDREGQRYCKDCHNKYQRENRKTVQGQIKDLQEQIDEIKTFLVI